MEQYGPTDDRGVQISIPRSRYLKAMVPLPRVALAACALAVVAQLCFLLLDPKATLISGALIAISAMLAGGACLHSASLRTRESRRLWALLGVAFLISSLGQILSTAHEFVTRTYTQSEALGADFLFFAYGIPILLAICSDGRDRGMRVLLWLEGGQAFVVAILVYLTLFSALPYFGDAKAISSLDLMRLNNGENWLLAGAVSFRLLSSISLLDRKFYRCLAVYLWVYLVVAGVVDWLELGKGMADGLQDVAWGIPYLALLASMVLLEEPNGSENKAQNKHQQTAVVLIENFSPLLFSFAIVLMAVRIAPAHSAIGLCCVMATLTLYGLRTALLQQRYLSSQDELTKTAFALMEANDHLSRLAMTDGLTGIPNRRIFDETLEEEWGRAARSGQSMSLLMIDVDCFKSLNDFYGHQEGDRCLQDIALRVLAKVKRPGDFVARYGGEEFAVILPGAHPEGALAIAEEIRISVTALSFPNERSIAGKLVTVSVGVATAYPRDGGSADRLLEYADLALYQAKGNGRDRCAAYTENLFAAQSWEEDAGLDAMARLV